ncbi:MAG: hypothetical protein ACI89X_001671 [Planctomycetota bacterium]|jgi:hypothetical protein
MHNFVRAALFATIFPVLMPAQETGTTEKPGTQQARQDERIRKVLKEHPKLKAAMRKHADANGDGKLDAAEKRALHKLLKARIAALKAQRKKDGAPPIPGAGTITDKPKASRLDRNSDGKVGRAERKRAKKIKNRVDNNNDGRVGPAERERAQRKKNRADRNDDGKVGPAERKRTKKARTRRKS